MTSTSSTSASSSSSSSSSFYPVSMGDTRLLDLNYNVRDGIEAVIKITNQYDTCIWTYLRDNLPSDLTGFMFSDNPVFSAIMRNMQVEHSGTSHGWTMRNLQYIANHGMDAYIAECKSHK